MARAVNLGILDKPPSHYNRADAPSPLAQRLSSVAITATVVCTVVPLVTKGDPLFPRLMLDEVRLSALWFYAAGSAALLSILTLIVLWVRRRSLLDLRLMVVMCAYVIT